VGRYRCRITDGSGNELWYYPTVKIDSGLNFVGYTKESVSIRKTIYAEPNKPLTLSVPEAANRDASGFPIKYAWKTRTTSGSETTIEGTEDASYTIPAVTGDTVGEYTCTVADGSGNTLSYIATVKVDTGLYFTGSASSASASSAEVYAKIGDRIELQVPKLHVNDGIALQYKWTKGGKAIPDATDSLYAFVLDEAAAGIYNCRIADAYGNQIYYYINVHIEDEDTLRFVDTQKDYASSFINGAIGESFQLKVPDFKGGKAPFTYQWQSWNNGTETLGTEPELATGAMPRSECYTCRITDAEGADLTYSVYITLDTGLRFADGTKGKKEETITVTAGQDVTLTANVVNDYSDAHPLEYQWYKLTPNSSTGWPRTEIEGATQRSYTAKNVVEPEWYCCRVEDDNNYLGLDYYVTVLPEPGFRVLKPAAGDRWQDAWVGNESRAALGERVEWNCLAESPRGSITYRWTHMEGNLNTGEKIISDQPDLVFEAVREEDYGTYYCEMSDGQTSRKIKFELNPNTGLTLDITDIQGTPGKQLTITGQASVKKDGVRRWSGVLICEPSHTASSLYHTGGSHIDGNVSVGNVGEIFKGSQTITETDTHYVSNFVLTINLSDHSADQCVLGLETFDSYGNNELYAFNVLEIMPKPDPAKISLTLNQQSLSGLKGSAVSFTGTAVIEQGQTQDGLYVWMHKCTDGEAPDTWKENGWNLEGETGAGGKITSEILSQITAQGKTTIKFKVTMNGLGTDMAGKYEVVAFNDAGTVQKAAVTLKVETDPVADFVERMYTKALGRGADPAGKAFWVGQLKNKKATAADMAANFLLSKEMENLKLSDSEFLNRMYRTFMDREADSGGKAFWQAKLNNGMSRKYVFAGFVNTKEFRDICATYGIVPGSYASTEARDKNENVTAFINRLYRTCMGRVGDAAGLNYWAARLQSGAVTGTAAAQSFIFSKEFTSKNLSDSAYLDIMYEAIFGRSSDADGKAYWQGLLDKGCSRKLLFANFASSKEFKTICAGYGITAGSYTSDEARDKNLKVTEFVNRMYKLCIGRAGDAEGLNYWAKGLLNKSLTGASVANNFMNSKEFINKNLSNSAYLDVMYKAMFGRKSDASGKNYWLTQMSKGTSRKQILASFVNSAEYSKICASYGVRGT